MGWDDVMKKGERSGCHQRGNCKHALWMAGSKEWDAFWLSVSKGEADGCCNMLDLFDSGDLGELSASVDLQSTGSRSVLVRIAGNVSGTINIDVTLSGVSTFGLAFSSIIQNNKGLSINVSSVQSSTGSRMLCKGRFVCADMGVLAVNTKGNIGRGLDNVSCVYDTRVLQVGEGGVVRGNPEMVVKGKDVTADHGFSVGRIPDEVRLFMESRGIGEKEAENLYIRGFLGW